MSGSMGSVAVGMLVSTTPAGADERSSSSGSRDALRLPRGGAAAAAAAASTAPLGAADDNDATAGLLVLVGFLLANRRCLATLAVLPHSCINRW